MRLLIDRKAIGAWRGDAVDDVPATMMTHTA
jgi:hypothetical protein